MENENKISEKVNATQKVKTFFVEDLWNTNLSELSKIKARAFMFTRIIVTTFKGVMKNRIPSQAASLSYATLLAIGPILAITVLISGMFYRNQGENFLYEKFMDIATFVMPAMNEMISSTDADGATKINPEVVAFIDNIMKGTSGLGAYGMFMMIITCLLLCVNMETAINVIWGQRKGRKWVDRFVFYFTLIFFGSVGVISGMTIITTSQISALFEHVPFLQTLGLGPWIIFAVGFLLMATVMAAFYKFIPVVDVRWKAAFVGAFLALILIVLNNKFSFFYIGYVAKQQTFYGYFSVVAIAMFSLYIFWLIILSGAQITCAVQLADFISDESVWEQSGSRTKELLAVAVFSEISRAFYEKRPAPNLSKLSAKLHVPKQMLSVCLTMLVEKNLVCASKKEKNAAMFFTPAISPDGITLGDFFKEITTENQDMTIDEILSRAEPSVKYALAAFENFARNGGVSKTMKEIIDMKEAQQA